MSESFLSALKLSYYRKLYFTLKFVNYTKMLFSSIFIDKQSLDYMDMQGGIWGI